MEVAAMLDELRALRQRLPEVSGVVLATVDGMPVTGDPPAVDRDTIAAMAATSLGLSKQFAQLAGHGVVREAVVLGAGGLVVTYPAGNRALLVVLVGGGVDRTRLHDEGRAVADRVGALYEQLRGRGWAAPVPTAADGCTPRPNRHSAPSSPLPVRHVLHPPARP